eukprot:COSAG06_NODE_61896_length_266_cov_0.928144_1_plen_30_part_10
MPLLARVLLVSESLAWQIDRFYNMQMAPKN